MDTIELIKDVALFGGTVPNERTEEVRDFLDNVEKQLNLDIVNGILFITTDEDNEICTIHRTQTGAITRRKKMLSDGTAERCQVLKIELME
jgi:hypothetical protein